MAKSKPTVKSPKNPRRSDAKPARRVRRAEPNPARPDLAAVLGLREVAMTDAPLRLVWAEPGSLSENPLNWKVHPDEQTAVVAESIARHGWIKPIIYNETTRRILDGHDRKKIADVRADLLVSGRKAVPVLVGRWDEAEEPEILATLDPSGSLARGDPEALGRLIAQMGDTTPLIRGLVDRVARQGGALGLLERARGRSPAVEPTFQVDDEDADGHDDPRGGSPDGPSASPQGGGEPVPRGVPVSQVRMVQLFLDAETFPRFHELVARLANEYGTDNPTDTVMAVMQAAVDEMDDFDADRSAETAPSADPDEDPGADPHEDPDPDREG